MMREIFESFFVAVATKKLSKISRSQNHYGKRRKEKE
jgi:hypothetical protein